MSNNFELPREPKLYEDEDRYIEHNKAMLHNHKTDFEKYPPGHPEYEVAEDGIYVYVGVTKDRAMKHLMLPKEIFIQAFKQYCGE